MTLNQLRYVIMVSEKGSFTEAAKELFLSQPSLTKSIRELEEDLGIEIFSRNNRGIGITRDGKEFLGYARQVLEQVDLIEGKYKNNGNRKSTFSISTQHYAFAVNAFVDLIKNCGSELYDFSIRETQTYEIIEDVAQMRSEIGLIYYNDFNRDVLMKIIKSYDLKFFDLFVANPHIFISVNHPLAKRDSVKMEELSEYPYLSFEQGEHNSFYFSEEIFSTVIRDKNIMVRDRATLFNLLIGLNGYTVSSGVIDSSLNADIVAVPLAEQGCMHIGYIIHSKAHLSKLGYMYIDALKSYIKSINIKLE